VCSKHFIEGAPTALNPTPTLELGYEKAAKKPRKELHRSNPFADVVELTDSPNPVLCTDDGNSTVGNCESCTYKDILLGSIQQEVTKVKGENAALDLKIQDLSKELEKMKLKNSRRGGFCSKNLKSESDMIFYTGLTTKVFTCIFNLLEPYLPKFVYWCGRKSLCAHKSGRQRKQWKLLISHKSQFLLVLMRLRLGLLMQDLAIRFNISMAYCSSIFTTWIKFLSASLAQALIIWLPKDTVLSNLPSVFKDAGYHKTRCIIDCTEMFIERPKSLHAQAVTWSDYKKHNTVKYLIAISPSGFIMFLSDGYGGRTSDQQICQDSTFYKKIEYGDEIMADRGFQIKEDLLHYYCSLSVPPGARLKNQMTTSECKRTKEIASLRIRIERAINRLKTYRILKTVLPITLLPLIDDIVRTCSALCNLKPPLIKER